MEGILERVPDTQVNGPRDLARRLPNNLNVSIAGIQGETMLLSLDVLGVAASAGSACTTGRTEPSHVLRAMGLTDAACRSALRFTVGRANSVEQIENALDAVVESVERARSMSTASVI
jgi:cysteine desulfurase